MSVAANSQPDATDPGSSVRIRMYGQGVGDCFLLSFPRTAPPDATNGTDSRVHIVIDCGVIGGTPDGPERMKMIVNDIRQTTGDHVDLLVLTHEHWDHLSGFLQAERAWRIMQVDQLWTSWTELDDKDGLPGVLKKALQRQTRALNAIADQAIRFNLTNQLGTVLGVAAFLSDGGGNGHGFGTAPGVSDAFAVAKSLVDVRDRVCCEPGDVRRVPGTDAVAYVLGPPRSDARLRHMVPARRTGETYANEGLPELDRKYSLLAMVDDRSEFNSFVAPFLVDVQPYTNGNTSRLPQNTQSASDDQAAYERSFPFEPYWRIPMAVAESAPLSEPETYSPIQSYFEEINYWRRIDSDWLGAAEAFALRADHLTNNTSLVLAFELPPGTDGESKVLLFTGDAQVGNWLSWYDIQAWRPTGGARPSQAKPDIPDLMKRVAFYKVGHHGSHNATLKTEGVDRMRRDQNLTAFVPVSQHIAQDIKGWDKMPLVGLLDALSEHAPGRVVLPNATIWPSPTLADARQLSAIHVAVATDSLPEVRSAAGDNTIEGPVPLWVEVTIPY